MPDGRLATLLLPQAPEETLGKRLGVCAFFVAIGAWMILVGRYNVRMREAEESGKRGLFYRMLGRPKVHHAGTAVALGWVRIVMGVFAIVLGVVYGFLGAFLKK